MEQRLSWEANSFTVAQERLLLFMKPEGSSPPLQ